MPKCGSPNLIAGPSLCNPTDRHTSVGSPLGSNSPVSGSAPLGISMATVLLPLFFAISNREVIGSPIGREMLKPNTPSRIKFDLSHKFAIWPRPASPSSATVLPPAVLNAHNNGSSSGRGNTRPTIASTPASTKYRAATIASPPLLPFPARASTVACPARSSKSLRIQSAITRPTRSMSSSRVMAPESNHRFSMVSISDAVTTF